MQFFLAKLSALLVKIDIKRLPVQCSGHKSAEMYIRFDEKNLLLDCR